jgi:hypothetical protein
MKDEQNTFFTGLILDRIILCYTQKYITLNQQKKMPDTFIILGLPDIFYEYPPVNDPD